MDEWDYEFRNTGMLVLLKKHLTSLMSVSQTGLKWLQNRLSSASYNIVGWLYQLRSSSVPACEAAMACLKRLFDQSHDLEGVVHAFKLFLDELSQELSSAGLQLTSESVFPVFAEILGVLCVDLSLPPPRVEVENKGIVDMLKCGLRKLMSVCKSGVEWVKHHLVSASEAIAGWLGKVRRNSVLVYEAALASLRNLFGFGPSGGGQKNSGHDSEGLKKKSGPHSEDSEKKSVLERFTQFLADLSKHLRSMGMQLEKESVFHVLKDIIGVLTEGEKLKMEPVLMPTLVKILGVLDQVVVGRWRHWISTSLCSCCG